MADKRKILYISDLHMSNSLPGAKPSKNGRTDRIDDQIRLWEHVAETGKQQGVDDYMVVGDLFDKARVDPVTLTVTIEAIVSLRGKKHILPGNHDCTSHRGGRFNVEAFSAMRKKGLVSLGLGDSVELSNPCDWLALHPLPYMSVEDTRSALKKLRKRLEAGVYNILLFHNSILGARHLGWRCDDGLEANEVCRGFNQVIAGHFHEHQVFGEAGRGMYLSAPMHHSFADVGRTAGYWVWTYEKGKAPQGEYIDPGLPKYFCRESSADDLVIPEGAKTGDFIRHIIPATHADWVAIKPRVLEFERTWNAEGYRVDHKHKPLLSAKKRFEDSSGKPATAIPMEKHVKRYLKRVGAGELNFKALLAEGLDILAESRAEEET